MVQHTLYGVPQDQYLQAHTAGPGVRLVPARTSTAPYVPPEPPDRSKNCIAKDDTCKGWRIEGSEYCMRHDPAVQAEMARRREERKQREP